MQGLAQSMKKIKMQERETNERKTVKKQTRYVKSIIVQIHAQYNEINLPDSIVVREENP